MIYLVSKQQSLFDMEGITNISLRQSLDMAASWDMLQIDSETTGRDPHLCDLLCFQIGDIEGNSQIVIDTTAIDIREYKDLLQDKYVIGHNLKIKFQL